MQLTSNVAAVSARVARLKDRDIPAALRAALRPEIWRELAGAEAEKTLLALAEPAQRQFIPEFIRTLKAEVFGTGFALRLHNPFTSGATVADYQAARAAIQPGDRGQNLFQNDVSEFEQLLAEWVGTEKHKDRRDEHKTDADIGNWLAYEFLAPDGGHLVASGPNKGRPVREVFMPYIVEFLERKSAASRLDAATVDLWLRAVLATWRQLVRAAFPGMFRAALRAQISELNLGGAQ